MLLTNRLPKVKLHKQNNVLIQNANSYVIVIMILFDYGI